MRSNFLNLNETAPGGHLALSCDRDGGEARAETTRVETAPAPGRDEIAGDDQYCRLELPWAPSDLVAYCTTRDDLWLVWRDLKPARTYLRVELEYLNRASAGEPDDARATLFRRMDRLKAMSGGWIVGIEGETEAMDGGGTGAGADVADGVDRADRAHGGLADGADPAARSAELELLKSRVRAAIEWFGRADVPNSEKQQFTGEFDGILERISELSESVRGDQRV